MRPDPAAPGGLTAPPSWRPAALPVLRRRWPKLARLGAGLAACLIIHEPACAFGLGDLFGGSGGGLGNIVYDPTNHLETAVSAAESVKQTALQVRAEIQRLRQLQVELQQLQGLPGDTVRAALADWDGRLGTLQEAAQALASLDQAIEASRLQSAGQLRQIVALGLSPRAWLLREAQAAAQRQQSAQQLFQAEQGGLQVLARNRALLVRLQSQIPASVGLQQSLQTTNQYLDLLAGQTSQMLALAAAQASGQARGQAAREADAAQATAREAERMQRDLDDIARVRTQLRQREARQGWGLLAPLPASVQASP